MPFRKFGVCHELFSACLQVKDYSLQAVVHALSGIVADDERHAQFGMFAERIELPWVEIRVEISVVAYDSVAQSLVEPKRKVVEREPEHRYPEPWRYTCRYLHHALLHEPCPQSGEVHVASGDESRVERGVVEIALTRLFLKVNLEHSRWR